jgi:hypothetical protein
MPDKITIRVNQQTFHVETATLSPDDFRALVDAPSDYEVWQVIRNPDPEGQLPVDDKQVTASITVKNGDRFRVVPPGTFGVTE